MCNPITEADGKKHLKIVASGTATHGIKAIRI